MKITRLTTYVVPPRWTFLKIETDDGISGWGEPVLEGRSHSVAAVVDELSDYLIGKDPFLIEDHWTVLYRAGFYRGGVMSRGLASMLGDRVNIYPVKGYAITVQLTEKEDQPARRCGEDRDKPPRRKSFPRGGHGRIQRLQPRYPRRAHRPTDRLVPRQFSGHEHAPVRALDGLEAHDAEHAAPGRPRPESACVLQHWPWASGMDAVRRNRGCGRRSRHGARQRLSGNVAPGAPFCRQAPSGAVTAS
jgi:hypothetical protein